MNSDPFCRQSFLVACLRRVGNGPTSQLSSIFYCLALGLLWLYLSYGKLVVLSLLSLLLIGKIPGISQELTSLGLSEDNRLNIGQKHAHNFVITRT
jgi:hypothetical protein